MLRSGVESNWYVDLRLPLGHGPILANTARAVIELADYMGLKFDAIAGMGVGGSAIKNAVLVTGEDLLGIDGSTADANDRYPRGLHGAKMEEVEEGLLLVDDVFTSGSSLFELADLINAGGGRGKIAGAIIACSRSDMYAHEVELEARGIPKLGTLTHFYEGYPPILVTA